MTQQSMLYAFILLVIGKMILNSSRYLLTLYYYSKYKDYLSNKNPSMTVFRLKAPIIALLREAGIEDSYIPFVLPVAYGMGKAWVSSGNTSHLDNPFHDASKRTMVASFNEALGEFRFRTLQSLNPWYWIQLVIFLPRHMVVFLGGCADSTISKVLSLIYWIFSLITIFLFELYTPEISTIIRSFLRNLIGGP